MPRNCRSWQDNSITPSGQPTFCADDNGRCFAKVQFYSHEGRGRRERKGVIGCTKGRNHEESFVSCSDHGFSVSCSSFYRQVAWLERVARYECPYIVPYTFVRNIALRTIDDASHETARSDMCRRRMDRLGQSGLQFSITAQMAQASLNTLTDTHTHTHKYTCERCRWQVMAKRPTNSCRQLCRLTN